MNCKTTTLRGLGSITLFMWLAACSSIENKQTEELFSDRANASDPVPSTIPDAQASTEKTETPLETADSKQDDSEAEPLNITVTTWRAERGHLESQVALGMAYAYGTGNAEKDPTQAKLWFELASMKGHSKAQFELGKLFYTGQGADQDYFNAKEWWIESALQGNLDAQQKIGYLYSEGLGVEQNFDKAQIWYKKAANLGHAEAQTLLGSLYHEGNRIPHDYIEAFKWYKLAAEQGHPHAQYTLGTLYHDGLGTEVDFIQCAAWVDVAMANGFDDEHDASGTCRGQLSELSNKTATHLANTWKKRYLSPGI